MNASTLKILVPLVLLVGVIFAITYFSQYTPPEPDEPTIDPKTVQLKKPLRFFSTIRHWDPIGSLQDQQFPGYFEQGQTAYPASFWFENRGTAAVHMQLKYVSCTSCSGGQVAPIPPDVTKQILQMTAISTLPQGLVSGLPLGLAVPTALLDAKRDELKWQYHKFDKAPIDIKYEIPGAPTGDRWAEQWAILQLQFQVKPGGGSLKAEFLVKADGSDELSDERFGIEYAAAEPFDLGRTTIDVGEMTEASPTQNHEILVYSSTRSVSELKLAMLVAMPDGTSGVPGPFVSVGQPVPVPEDKIEEMAIRISMAKQPPQPTRVRSAFRVPVTISSKVGDAKLDIGSIERNISFTQGTDTKQVRVRGSMRGPASIVGARELGFGAFTSSDLQTATATIETERSGVELEIVKELTVPKFLKVELVKQPDNGERGSYRLKATIPAGEQLGDIRDGLVVLQAKGPNPLRLRIPVTGRGR